MVASSNSGVEMMVMVALVASCKRGGEMLVAMEVAEAMMLII